MKALETGNINYVLIWVPELSGDELTTVFARALAGRKTGPPARDVGDDWFLETAIRPHRSSEGAPLYRDKTGWS